MLSPTHRCLMPPEPAVLAELYDRYKRSGVAGKISFKEFLAIIGYDDPSVNINGMDDGVRITRAATAAGPQLFAIPERKVAGSLRILVLLVDFADRPGTRDVAAYQSMLFSDKQYPTGSLRDFYREVSCGKVSVTGSVHGWLRMSRPYAYYVNKSSGTNAELYPANAQGLCEEAVRVAMAASVPFPRELDLFEDGNITALFVVHAGLGAESLSSPQDKNEIWSHKWFMPNPVAAGPGLTASTYLIVPQNCKLGVCAHELGHLAFQWEDFYDANYNEDGQYWDGSGNWDLMASGAYNGRELSPAHPCGLHKLQHDWVSVKDIGPAKGRTKITIPPSTGTAGHVVRVHGPKYRKGQYLFLENRQKAGFDFALPGPGLLVWRVDESKVNTGPSSAGLTLVQADGKNDLDNPDDHNQGDAGDPFPGHTSRTSLGDSGPGSTSFTRSPSRVRLEQISVTRTGTVSCTVVIT